MGGGINKKRYTGIFGQCSSEKGLKTQNKQIQLKLHFSSVLCEVKVILIHAFLKIDLELVTLHRV